MNPPEWFSWSGLEAEKPQNGGSSLSFGEATFPGGGGRGGGGWLGLQEEGKSRAFCVGSLPCSPSELLSIWLS